MKNNKGQALVAFILLLPLSLMILFSLLDISRIVNKKLEMDSISNMVLTYGLDNIENEFIQENLNNLIEKNKCNIDSIEIDTNKKTINMTITSKFNLYLFKNNKFTLKNKYIGKIDNGNKIIEREH